MRYDEDALCIVVEVRRRRATCDPGKAQMRDEKPPRRQAGQLRGHKDISPWVEACRAGHEVEKESTEESGTGAEDEQGRPWKSFAARRAKACKSR